MTAPTIDFNLVLDCGKAKKEIGWKAQVNLSDGIKKKHWFGIKNTFL